MASCRAKRPARLARRLLRAFTFRQLRDSQKEITSDFPGREFAWKEHLDKEIVVERQRKDEVLSPLSGVLANVKHSKATGLAAYLTIITDNNSIGGKPMRIHVNHITHVTVRNTREELKSLLEEYVGEY